MMQPPGRIEQLNNFQDSIQSPDGLDRLRALQYIEQALPSSQGLSGMPQVTVPTPQMQPQVPMMNRAYGGEIGTGGLINVLEDGTQVFDNSQEGALNRATHGGVLEGFNYTPSTGGTATATATPVTTNSLDAPGTLASGTTAPSGFTIETDQDKYGNTIGDLTGMQDYYNLNFAARDAGQDTFMYGDKLMQVDPGYLQGGGLNPFISNRFPAGLQQEVIDRPDLFRNASNVNTITKIQGDPTDPGFYSEPAYLPIAGFNQDVSRKYNSYYDANQAAKEAGSPTFMYGDKLAKTDPGLLPDYDYSRLGPKPFISNAVPEKYISAGVKLPPGWNNMSAQQLARAQIGNYRLNAGIHGANPKGNVGTYGANKHGGPVINRAYGGEIGTGGLVDILDDGTQVFNNSQEGALNRATYGGVLEGYNFTPSTGGTATAGVTTNSLDAPGTLASGVDYSSSSGVPGIASGALADLPSVQQRQGIYNASEFKDIGMSLDRPSDAPETILGYQAPQSTLRIPTRFDSSGNPIPGSEKIPQGAYVPKTIQTYGQGYDLGGLDYITANQLAFNEGADRFMYGDKFAQTDPGLLSNYDYLRDGPKPYMDADFMPKNQDDFAAAGGNFTGKGMTTQSNIDNQLAKAQGYKRDFSGRLVDKFGNPVQQKAGGGQVDPSQSAQGLASLGRYGDNILVHMNPEELDGLASLGEITYNPVTGLPEAWGLRNIFRAVRKIAPIALAIAAPYAFGATTALGIGASSAFGSFAGNLIAGAKPKDALKAGLMSGLFAGGGAYLGGAASGFGGSAATQGGTSAVTSGVSQGGLNISNPAFVADGGSSVLQTGLGTTARTAGNAARGISQFGGTASNAPVASLAGSQSNMIQTSPLSYSSANVPQQYSQSIGNTNQIGLGNANVASPVNVAPVNQFAGGDGLMSSGPVTGTDLTQNLGGTQNIIPNNTGSTSIFSEGGLSKENLSNMGKEIYSDYANPKGIAKLVAMDLSTPDWEAQYAAEAAAKNRQLTDAGYTVETGFDGQTVIRDSTGVVMPRNLTVQDILDRALGKQKRTNLVARTDYRESTPEERAAMEKSRLAQGGLISLKHGGEFSGMVPGDGHGMEDNVYMPIVEKGHGSQVGTLAVSPSEYVVDSYTMAALGNGNADAGAKVMDNVVKRVRKKAYGDTKQPNEISGLQALEPMIERV
ncbi:hypothetical protein OAE29_05600 [Octadecabacter sp.]|nr:hypothetical protein [Octadecabacter sp.]